MASKNVDFSQNPRRHRSAISTPREKAALHKKASYSRPERVSRCHKRFLGTLPGTCKRSSGQALKRFPSGRLRIQPRLQKDNQDTPCDSFYWQDARRPSGTTISIFSCSSCSCAALSRFSLSMTCQPLLNTQGAFKTSREHVIPE